MRTHKLSLIFSILLVCFLALSVSLQPLLAQAAPATAENSPTAGNSMAVVVQFSETDRLIRKVEFSSSTITGLQALLNSGLDVVTQNFSWGTAVCAIEGVGCPASNCFCDSSKFWNYEYWDGSQWQSHTSGASSTNRNDGAIDGWRWGEWTGTPILPYPQLERAWNALQWLKTQQNSDGGYGSPNSAAPGSVESLLAIGANHYKAAEWKLTPTSSSLKDYIDGNATSYITNASSAGKLGVGSQKSSLTYQATWPKPSTYYNSSTGIYQNGAGPQAWAILGALALGENVPPEAIDYLLSLADANGGWAWSAPFDRDTNTTALAIQALRAAGRTPRLPQVQKALDFLHQAQKNDGGFPFDPAYGSDTNSTAYVLQALYAIGEDPTSNSWKKNGNSPLDFLATAQLNDGSFEWQVGQGSNLLATQQVIPALLGNPSALSLPTLFEYYFPLIQR